ncbi:hypothetical protein GCK32_020860 [Trichostrongylus colubriformis]|uniref:Receptor L-domain domain-containing protein n=1 Tax=Trichostrongylus colubriformis TaxID=6319 RepID=A0AAN8FE50_TRICO
MRNLFVTIEALEPLNRIKKIDHGALIFEDNTGFESISFLNSLEEIDNSASEEPAIQISNNVGLLSIGLPALRKVMSGGEGPIVQIYSLNALPAEDDTRFREMTGGRYYSYVHNKDAEESEEDSTGLGSFVVFVLIAKIVNGACLFAYHGFWETDSGG